MKIGKNLEVEWSEYLMEIGPSLKDKFRFSDLVSLFVHVTARFCYTNYKMIQNGEQRTISCNYRKHYY